MNQEGIIIMFLFMLMGFSIGGLVIYNGLTLEVGITETKCFDRFSNEIVGEICLREVEELEPFMMVVMGFMLILFLSFAGYAMGDMMKNTCRF